MTDFEISWRANLMVGDLEVVILTRLMTEKDHEERRYLEGLLEKIPWVSLILGHAVAAREPGSAIRGGL